MNGRDNARGVHGRRDCIPLRLEKYNFTVKPRLGLIRRRQSRRVTSSGAIGADIDDRLSQISPARARNGLKTAGLAVNNS
ncbi:MAG: hypothetical protein DME99_10860 [Verrucomicrobia bacterium]|nr:MAG: hypothetical protein DME99_10860 [Verrucomicrobiota bacterium]